jgi:hypothetical protein
MTARPLHSLLLALLLTIITVGTARAAVHVTKEYQLKAAFLYNFVKFVGWPDRRFATQESPIVIGVLGDNPFGTELQDLVKNRKIGARPIVVRHFLTAESANLSHLMFVSSGEVKRYVSIKHLLDPAVLAVGESEAFARHGGGITFNLHEDKLRFSINMAAAERGDLKVSAQLQKLASSIHR